MANALAGLGKLLGGILPKKKRVDDPNAPLLMEPGQAEWEALRELGIGDPATAPPDRSLIEPAAPIFPFESMGGVGDVSGSIQEPPRRRSDDLFAMLEGFMKDAQTPAPEATKPQVQPLEQLLELYAVSQGGASNLGGAYDLASQRTAFGDAQAMRAWESKVGAAKTGLQYGVPLFNAALDQETALDQLEFKLKQAEVAGQARQAAAAVKANKEVRFKIGQLVADGKESVPAISQILMATDADPELAQATAEQIMRDIQMNTRGWLIQHKTDQEARLQGVADGRADQAAIKLDVDTLQSLESSPVLKIAAAGRLIQAGYFPPNSDPVAIAADVSEKMKESAAITAVRNARADILKIEKQIKETTLKDLPQQLRDKHAKNLAQIQHWKNMDNLSAAGLDFKMAESARDNLVNRYGKALDAMGRDISDLTRDVISLRDKRKEWEKLEISIMTSANGKAADPKNQADLDKAKLNIAAYDKSVREKLDQRAKLQELARELRDEIENEDIEGEVEAGRTRVQTPSVGGGSSAPAPSSTPKGKSVTGARTGATLSLRGG